jgi:hypothetical protein
MPGHDSRKALDLDDDLPCEWSTVGGDARSWWTYDTNAGRWHLRRHSDCWVLLQVISSRGTPHPPRQLSAIIWANDQIHHRFRTTCDRWRTGPATGEAGLVALYCDTQDTPIAKPGPTTLDMIASMY